MKSTPSVTVQKMLQEKLTYRKTIFGTGRHSYGPSPKNTLITDREDNQHVFIPAPTAKCINLLPRKTDLFEVLQ